MRLQISSNLVAGAYSIFDVFILCVVARGIATIAGCWNVKRIYDDEKQLHLSGSPLSYFLEQGLTSRKMHISLLTLFSITVFLVTTGQFAIVGVTEDMFEDIMVRNLVSRNPTGQALNVTEHMSADFTHVSGTIMLLNDFSICVTRTPAERTIYAYVNDLNDISTPKFPIWPPSRFRNSTCITKEDKFKEQIAFEHQLLPLPVKYLSQECLLNVDVTRMPLNTLESLPAIIKPECPFPVVEAWCFRSTTAYCVLLSEVPGGFAVSTLTGINPQRHSRSKEAFLKSRLESSILKTAVMLTAAGVSGDPANLPYLALLRVETDVTAQKITRTRDVTEVDVLFLCLTMGGAMFCAGFVVLLALLSWVRIVLLPGRRTYNRFNSAMDLIHFAHAVGLKDDNRKILSKHVVPVGISASEPHVGPLRERHTTGAIDLPEDELSGRLTS